MPPSVTVNDQRVLEILIDGEWHDEDELTRVGMRLDMAIARCYAAGLIEYDTYRYRLTAAGKAQLPGQ